MTHERFWALTPREFAELCDGERMRSRRRRMEGAELASWIISGVIPRGTFGEEERSDEDLDAYGDEVMTMLEEYEERSHGENR